MGVPSPALLARLPNGKLPDRQDFHRYGQDHASRQRDWRRAMAECERLAQGPACAEVIDRFRAALAARDIVPPDVALAILAERGRFGMEQDGRRREVAVNRTLLDDRQ